MRRSLLTLTFLAASTCLAAAQYGPPELPAQWNQYGSAVCPDGYDYAAQIDRCVARGYGGGYHRRAYRGYGYGYGDGDRDEGQYGGGVPARWNRYGSAVCPGGYDYVAAYNACFPR